MLEDLIVEDRGKRYVGHVWAPPERPLMAGQLSLRWCFAHRGQVVAEFPATVLDTPETVSARLRSIMARIQPRKGAD